MLALRKKLLASCFVVVVATLVLFSVHRHLNPSLSVREKFYAEVFQNIKKFSPIHPPKQRESVKLSGCDMGSSGINKGDSVARTTYKNLDRCYKLSNLQFEGLQAPHTGFLAAVRGLFKYESSSSIHEQLFPREEGFVTVGGGRFSLLSYTMIKTLRERGSTLPVEVVIPPQDEAGEEHYCNEVLPELNGRCVFFSDVLPKDLLSAWEFKRYQIKSVALLISSFKKIVFIDADDFPLKNLDSVFKSDVVKQNGLVLWPDLWRRVTAPVFYRIANVDVDLNDRVRNLGDDVSPPSRYQKPGEKLDLDAIPFHDLQGAVPDPTSESGQMIIDKVRHLQTLLLALYYNVYGPEWYYSLMSQGTAGEGDKETFATAAHVLGLPYYQVKTKLAFDGYHSNGGFSGVALLQHDCVQDFELHERAISRVRKDMTEYQKFDPAYDAEDGFYNDLQKRRDKSDIDVMFAHASYHKFDPWQLYNEKIYLNPDGSQFRSFHNLKKIKYFDIELFNFEVLQSALCSTKVINFAYLKDKYGTAKWTEVCQYVNDRVTFLRESHKSAIGQV
ncbi:LAME_0G03664g1_1 [Lachancea meyersii CBS 8951]|uniref:LAME_0G03664g1_1 n=1 Tax=Lachancea meyersii CBS 8951 TaxID=1266667 RepID=A0A1G4K6Q6_9SACH|nr:LAME_0G03664g1_1 [Lachancea meyersii CBS 8951]